MPNKTLYYCTGEGADDLAELITANNPRAKIFSKKFVETYKQDPGDDNWENLNEFRKVKRMKNYYLHEITGKDKDLIVVTIPDLDPVNAEYLKEAADICEYQVKSCPLYTYLPKEPLPTQKKGTVKNTLPTESTTTDEPSDNEDDTILGWFRRILSGLFKKEDSDKKEGSVHT